MTEVAFYGVLAIPYVYVVARVASAAYFVAKLRYHKAILRTVKGETASHG